MPKYCTVYCLNEGCPHYNKGATIFGTCNHPVHQNLRPIDDRTQLLLETCPWKTLPQDPRNILIERYFTALPGYIVPPRCVTGPSVYAMVNQMLSVKRYRPIYRGAEVVSVDNPWPEGDLEKAKEY